MLGQWDHGGYESLLIFPNHRMFGIENEFNVTMNSRCQSGLINCVINHSGVCLGGGVDNAGGFTWVKGYGKSPYFLSIL